MITFTIFLLFSLPCSFTQAQTPGYTDSAQEPARSLESSDLSMEDHVLVPTYISLAPNINDFGRFADGGSDSNWYIGFNNAWIVKLPPAPPGKYTRAFIGAKIGRAKATPKLDRPWELSLIPGQVYMAISQVPSFASEQSFFLTETRDIPLEPNQNIYMPGTGRSEWFWAEIPTLLVSSSRPNYLIIWSPSRDLREATSSPILAALDAGKENSDEASAWNNHSISGVPPRSESGTLQTPIMNIKPALAIKLTPPSSLTVRVTEFSARSAGNDLLARFSVDGKNLSLAWIEISSDDLEWRRISPYLRQPPYLFTLPRNLIPTRGAYLRARATDLLDNEGHSTSVFISHGSR